jgi:hypothetical protein
MVRKYFPRQAELDKLKISPTSAGKINKIIIPLLKRDMVKRYSNFTELAVRFTRKETLV